MLILVYIWLALLTVSIYLIARHVGDVVRRVTPHGARFDNEGPRIGECVAQHFPEEVRSFGDQGKIFLFKSDSCGVCKFINPENLKQLEKHWGKKFRFVIINENEGNESSPEVIRDIMVFNSRELRSKLNINYVPFAFKTNEEGVVTMKGLVNNLGNVESILED